MRLPRFVLTVLLVVYSIGGSGHARAGYVSVNLNGSTDYDIRQSPYQTVSSLPMGGSTINVGNTSFTLATYNGQAGTTGVVQAGSPDGSGTASNTVDIAVNIRGALEVDTLINSVYDSLNQMSGMIQFFGTNGAFVSFNLVQGQNIRDYNVGSFFNNVIAAGTNTVTYTSTTPTASGTFGTRLDEQIFTLGSSFVGQTLTDIRLINTSTFVFNGAPFLAAATVFVPEPGSATLCGLAALISLGRFILVRKRTQGLHKAPSTG